MRTTRSVNETIYKVCTQHLELTLNSNNIYHLNRQTVFNTIINTFLETNASENAENIVLMSWFVNKCHSNDYYSSEWIHEVLLIWKEFYSELFLTLEQSFYFSGTSSSLVNNCFT